MKRAIMQMTGALLSQILIEGNEIHVKVENGLPEDAKFVNGRHVVNLQGVLVFELIYESEEFEDVEEGGLLPILKPAMFTRMECGEDTEIETPFCSCGQPAIRFTNRHWYCEECI